MNAISGPTCTSAITSLLTNGAVRPVRPVTSGTQRSASGVDRFVRSSGAQAAPALTYGRNGRGASVASTDRDGDGDSA